jgi:hypothetical protein
MRQTIDATVVANLQRLIGAETARTRLGSARACRKTDAVASAEPIGLVRSTSRDVAASAPLSTTGHPPGVAPVTSRVALDRGARVPRRLHRAYSPVGTPRIAEEASK